MLASTETKSSAGILSCLKGKNRIINQSMKDESKAFLMCETDLLEVIDVVTLIFLTSICNIQLFFGNWQEKLLDKMVFKSFYTWNALKLIGSLISDDICLINIILFSFFLQCTELQNETCSHYDESLNCDHHQPPSYLCSAKEAKCFLHRCPGKKPYQTVNGVGRDVTSKQLSNILRNTMIECFSLNHIIPWLTVQ